MGKVNVSRRFRRSAVAGAALAAALPLVPRAARAQNATNSFNAGTDLTNPASYSLGSPAASQDVVLNTSGGTTLTDNGSAGLAMGSLDVTNGTAYTVTMTAANTSSITLGGGLNQVSPNPADLLYLSGNSSLNIGNGSGTLGLVLGAAGNVDVTAGSTLTVGSVLSGANGLTVTGGGGVTVTAANTYTGATAVAGGTLTAIFTGANTATAGVLGVSGSTISIGAPSGTAASSLVFVNGGTGSPSLTYNVTAVAGGTGASAITFENATPSSILGTTFQTNLTLDNGLTIDNDIASTGASPPHLTLQGTAGSGTAGLQTLTFDTVGLGTGNAVANTALGSTTGGSGTASQNFVIGDGSGQVAVVFAGNQYGQVLVKSAQTYTGGTTITGGLVLLQINAGFAAGGAMTFNQSGSVAAELSLNGYNLSVGSLSTAPTSTSTTLNEITGTSASALTVTGTGTYGGEIVGAMGLKVTGGNLTLSGTANAYSGATTITGGSLYSAHTFTTGAIGIGTGGTLGLYGTSGTISSAVALTGAPSVVNVASGVTYTVSGVVSGAGTLLKTGPGTLYLTATNTFAGADVSAGTLEFSSNGTLGAAVAETTTIETGGTVDFQLPSPTGNGNPSITSGRTFALNGSGGQIGVLPTYNASAWTIAGPVVDGTGGAGTLNKIGAGTLVLTSASNTYSGGTNVNAGTLRVANAAGSGTGGGTVTVNAGVLAGTGSVTGPVVVTSAGTITAGSGATPADSTGVLTTVGPQTWMAGGSYDVKINGAAATAGVAVGSGASGTAGVASDELVLGGLTVSSTGLTINPVFTTAGAGGLVVGQYSFVIADSAAAGAFDGLLADNAITVTPGSAGTFSLTTMADGAGTGEDLVLNFNDTAAPEPTSLLLLLGVVAGPLALGRRRR